MDDIKRSAWRRLWGRFGAGAVAAGAGLAWFLVAGGARTLDPTRLGWALKGDWAPSLLGWLNFRVEPWHWPLGRIADFPEPLGTSVGYTDSIPGLAIAAKAFSPLLPPVFQYLGLWLAACFALQGWVGAWLTARLTPRAIDQALGGALFVVAPPLVHRLGHASLCAHWLILAAFALYLGPPHDARAARRRLAGACAVVVGSAFVHPYLAVMTAALAAAVALRLRRSAGLPWRDLALASLVVAAGLMAAAGLGEYGRAEGGAPGFGWFSADVLALVNPMGASRFLPALPARGGQYEGFAYLGVGVLVVGTAVLVLWLLRREPIPWTQLRAHGSLVVACVLLALFALSSRITVGGLTVASAQILYAPFHLLTDPLRSSGRFIWPLAYLVLLGVIAAAARLGRTRPAEVTAFLVAALVLQVVDLGPWAHASRFEQPGRPLLVDAAWSLAKPWYRHLALYPPLVRDGGRRGCSVGLYSDDSAVPWAELALRLGMKVNSAYLARIDVERTRAYCEEERRRVEAGALDPGTVYVVHSKALARFRERTGAACGELEGNAVCVAAANQDPFRQRLASP